MKIGKLYTEIGKITSIDNEGTNEVFEVLDEAREEFPDVFKGINEKLLSDHEILLLLVKQNRERWNWFTECFGELR